MKTKPGIAGGVDEAIAIIEECRLTHVQWADWQEATPDWRTKVTPESPGAPEHHREWVSKYDRVLEVLRAFHGSGPATGGDYDAESDALAQRLFEPAASPAEKVGGATGAGKVPFAERHCQNGHADVCRAAHRDGVICPEESCDIDDGIRQPDEAATPAGGGDADMEPLFKRAQKAADALVNWRDAKPSDYYGARDLLEGARMIDILLSQCRLASASPVAAGGGDGFVAWLDRDWPLWRNDPDNPNVARLRRAWDESRLASAPARVGDDWIPVGERLPPEGDQVLVYTPDTGDGYRIDFDGVDEGRWIEHEERREHFLMVGGAAAAGPDCVCTGPGEEAPYTHWQPLPAAPAQEPQQ